MSASQRISTDMCERLFAAMVPFFECDIHCVLEFTGRLDVERMTNAFLVALAEEPMWSHRFVPAFWRPYWEPIPRDERCNLVRVINTDGSQRSLEAVMLGPVDAAARIFILRGPTDDTVCFRVDHRLADATAARMLIRSIEAHYRAATSIPSNDAPVVRRTIALLRTVVSEEQRQEFLKELRKEIRSMEKSPAAFRLPDVTPDDPAELPIRLDFPSPALEELTARAMQDRGTATLAILAALALAMRDVTTIAPTTPLDMGLMVNLRRYLSEPAPASMLIGQSRFRVEHADPISMSEVMQQLRERMKADRGPHFGLRRSPVSADVPRIRFLMRVLPFALMRFFVRQQYRNFKMTPDVCVSDLGDFGKPGDVWGEAVLRNGYSQAGIWNVPSISVCSSTCGSRLTISVGARPRSFTQSLATVLRRHLCDYVGWPQS